MTEFAKRHAGPIAAATALAAIAVTGMLMPARDGAAGAVDLAVVLALASLVGGYAVARITRA